MSALSRDRSTVQSTRQQLEELDALLQRMMDLPAASSDPESAPAPTRPGRPVRPPSVPSDSPTVPPKRAYPPSYMVVESSTPSYLEPPTKSDPIPAPVPGGRHDLVEDHRDETLEELSQLRARAEQQEGDWVPLRSSWQPSAQTWKPLAESWHQSRDQVSAPTSPYREVPVQTPAPMARQPMAPAMPQRPTESNPSQEHWGILLPIVWFNMIFDAFLYPLGPLGTWLRGTNGRGVLGALGFACLLAAAGLAAVTMSGWTP